jgi:hypothetical protein
MTDSVSRLSLEQDILARAAEDWISAAEVLGIVRRSGLSDPSDLRDLAVEVLSRLLIRGLLVAGEIDGGSFREWPVPPAQAITAIARDWSEREWPLVMPGEIAWFDTTPSGQQIGEQYWRTS